MYELSNCNDNYVSISLSSVLCKLQTFTYLISVPVVIKFNFNVVVLVI